MSHICLKCSGTGAVKDSRPSYHGTWRRRIECRGCGHRWSTIEMTEEMALSVIRAAEIIRRIQDEIATFVNVFPRGYRVRRPRGDGKV